MPNIVGKRLNSDSFQGPGRILQRKLQAKFYRNDNNHADYGDKLEALIWKCAVDNAGNITVVDETVK